jgi:shikimate kinase
VRIVLTGFMGAGKTTVGRRLAADLGIPFLDLDEVVAERAGCSIRELFERAGEGEFRQRERAELAELLAHDPVVIATGGGTLADPEVLARVKDAALVVWINPAFATIARRLGPRGKEDRPLFRSEAEAFELYRQRLPAYRRADLVIDVGPEEEPAEVAARLALRIGERACST